MGSNWATSPYLNIFIVCTGGLCLFVWAPPYLNAFAGTYLSWLCGPQVTFLYGSQLGRRPLS